MQNNSPFFQLGVWEVPSFPRRVRNKALGAQIFAYFWAQKPHPMLVFFLGGWHFYSWFQLTSGGWRVRLNPLTPPPLAKGPDYCNLLQRERAVRIDEIVLSLFRIRVSVVVHVHWCVCLLNCCSAWQLLLITNVHSVLSLNRDVQWSQLYCGHGCVQCIFVNKRCFIIRPGKISVLLVAVHL